MFRNTLLMLLLCMCLVLGAEPVGDEKTETSDQRFKLSALGSLDVFSIYSKSRHYENWKLKSGIGYEIGASYELAPRWILHSGIKWQRFGSTGYYYHTEPYLLSYRLRLKSEHVRFPLELNFCFPIGKEDEIFAGFGTYIDWNYYGEVAVNKVYVSESSFTQRVITNAMGNTIPGWQIALGSKADKNSVELRYWIDIPGFSLPESGKDFLRRSGVELVFGREILQF
ncbi:MAG TPA: hypothetical protein PL160_04245 [Candidatus Cloacimonas sp.]|nr:hypothetical protein [Candidatus Cloacimonas sp.]